MKCHLYAAWEAQAQNSWCKVTGGGKKKNPCSMQDFLVFVISTSWNWSQLFLL